MEIKNKKTRAGGLGIMRKLRWVVCLVFILVAIPFTAMAANTFNTTQLPFAIQITACDTAWTWTTHWTDNRHARGIKVDYILFNPGATGDIVTIHEGSASGPVIVRFVAADIYDQRIIYLDGALIRPYLATPSAAPNAAAFITIKLSDDD